MISAFPAPRCSRLCSRAVSVLSQQPSVWVYWPALHFEIPFLNPTNIFKLLFQPFLFLFQLFPPVCLSIHLETELYLGSTLAVLRAIDEILLHRAMTLSSSQNHPQEGSEMTFLSILASCFLEGGGHRVCMQPLKHLESK